MDIKAGDNDVAISNAGKIETLMAQLEKTVLSFLSLARADNLDTPVEAIDLHKTVEGIRAGLSHQITSSGVRVQTDLRVRDVFAQGARIGQILENLISNGVKYHDPEKTEKLVRVSSHYSAGGNVQLTVEDNGCGVPAHATEKIFDSFSRFHEDSEGWVWRL
jgi:signal transduction histidine kinase